MRSLKRVVDVQTNAETDVSGQAEGSTSTAITVRKKKRFQAVLEFANANINEYANRFLLWPPRQRGHVFCAANVCTESESPFFFNNPRFNIHVIP